jgi:hypothetical protein
MAIGVVVVDGGGEAGGVERIRTDLLLGGCSEGSLISEGLNHLIYHSPLPLIALKYFFFSCGDKAKQAAAKGWLLLSLFTSN